MKTILTIIITPIWMVLGFIMHILWMLVAPLIAIGIVIVSRIKGEDPNY